MVTFYQYVPSVEDGKVLDIAPHNLADDAMEVYDYGEYRVVRVEAEQADIDTWAAAQTVELVLAADADPAQSATMVDYKQRLLSKINRLTSEAITAAYPLYKQNNINMLQGYTEADRDAMWAYINEKRGACSAVGTAVESATTLAELQTIEGGM